jgi:glycine/D-amino acid oxidase-like deaminating enzyme
VTGVFEPTAGFLLVEDCVTAHLTSAQAAGATLMVDTVVRGWTATDREVRVQSDRGEIAAERLVITAGPWAAQMLSELSVPLSVRRKSLFWFATERPEYNEAAGFPVFFFEIPERSPGMDRGSDSHGFFYGFPRIDERGVKIAEHSGGRSVDDPLVVDRSIDLGEQCRVTDVLSGWLPHVSQRVVEHAVCLYTMSPDEHFIVDCHPVHTNVVFAAGLSGHGFKFAPVLGIALAQLAVDGHTELPIDFLSLDRLRSTRSSQSESSR